MRKKNAILFQKIAAVSMAAALSISAVLPTFAESGSYLTYYSDYASKSEAYQHGYELNQQIAEEAIVLLKNDNSILPLKDVSNVTVFEKGRDSKGAAIGGSTSAFMGDNTAGINVFDALREAGYNVNPVVEAFDLDDESSPISAQEPETGAGSIVNETPIENYTEEVWNSCEEYNDAAVVVLTRTTGEGGDVALFSAESLPDYEENGVYYGTEDSVWLDADGNEINKLDQAAHIDDHYLQLTKYEADLLVEIGERFDKIIVVLNSSSPIQPDFLKSNEDGYCDLSYYTGKENSMVKIDAALWTGGVGLDGIRALGKILNGTVTPSGHTADLWEADYKASPAAINSSYNGITDGNRLNFGLDEDGHPIYTNENYVNAPEEDQLCYDEGIYVGYRWYETAAYEIQNGQQIDGYTDGETWYSDSVVYPFGYGLSYTSFQWEVVGSDLSGLSNADGKGEMYVDVQVTNTGDYAGKEVVQLYTSAPYTGKVEKSHVVLTAFAKTGLLQPGESETVTLSFTNYDIASYDMDATISSGSTTVTYGDNSGYLLESGTWYFAVCTDSHTIKDGTSVLNIAQNNDFVLKADLEENILITNDPDTGAEITNQFNDATDGLVYYGNNNNIKEDGEAIIPWLSRADFAGTMPQVTKQASLTRSTQYMDELYRTQIYATGIESVGTKLTTVNSVMEDDDTKATAGDWTASEWYQNRATAGYSEEDENGNRVIVRSSNADRIGKTIVDGEAGEGEVSKILLYDLTTVDYDDTLWEDFLDQLTIEDLMGLLTYGGFGTYGIEELGVPYARNTDGPENLCFDPTEIMGYTYQSMLASTFNVELAYELGRSFGNEAMWAEPVDRDMGAGTLRGPISGWYAPDANMHRTKFGGRSYGYYSEDPVLAGNMLVEECQGARDMGLITYINHVALNDQETDRNTGGGLLTWANEQTIREIDLKACEKALKGPSLGIMTGFNRIGDVWNGQNYALLENVIRNEWGFKGAVITDGWDSAMDCDRFLRNGTDLGLQMNLFAWDMINGEPTYPGATILVEKLNEDGTVARDENGTIIFEEQTMDFDTQLAALRNAAKHSLYSISQSTSMRNGACLEYMITDAKDIGTVKVGEAFTYDASFSDLYEHNTVKYKLYAGQAELPEGLAIDSETGTISGVVAETVEAGTYTFQVEGRVDGWAPKYVQYAITVVTE